MNLPLSDKPMYKLDSAHIAPRSMESTLQSSWFSSSRNGHGKDTTNEDEDWFIIDTIDNIVHSSS